MSVSRREFIGGATTGAAGASPPRPSRADAQGDDARRRSDRW